MISKKTKYALKALQILAEDYNRREPILISHLAKTGHIPKKFLELILLELKNNGILQSKKGKGGGYLLAKSPDKISLGAILRILEGALAPLPCLSRSAYRKCEECEDESTCAIRLVMKNLHETTVQILDGTTLKNLIEQAHSTQEVLMYAI